MGEVIQTADTRTVLCGIELDNPVIPASGTFGFGYEFAALYDINCLGTFSFKGTTREARFGNPTPRIADCTAGMINAVGLQNPGVDDVIAQELPRLRACFRKPVMANVSGFSVEEYAYTCERLGREPQVGWLEVNVSCPNVHGGGMSFGTDPAAAASVVRAVRAVTDKPLLVKLSPNVTDIVTIAKACEAAGADGASTSAPAAPCLPTGWADSPDQPFSRWRCAWSIRSRARSASPLWVWAASPPPPMSSK